MANPITTDSAHLMENWPLPPFFKDLRASPEHAAPEAIVFGVDGTEWMGQLESFSPATMAVRFTRHGDTQARTLLFTQIKSIQLLPPVTLGPDTELIAQYQQAGGQEVHPAERPFQVVFRDGSQLHGETKGFVKTPYGLFVFLLTTEDRVVRIFVTEASLRSYRVGTLLGEQLINARIVAPEAVAQALDEQAKRYQLQVDTHLGDDAVGGPTVNLGDILMTQGLVSRDQLFDAFTRMEREKRNMLGHILVEMGVLNHARLTQAVAEQLSIPAVSLRDFSIPSEVIAMASKAYAFEHHVLPLLATGSTLVVAVESLVDAHYLDQLHTATGRQIVPVIANPEELSARIAAEYANHSTEQEATSIDEEIEQLTRQLASGRGDLQTSVNRQVSDSDTLLVRLVNKIISDAHAQGASDIHVETYPEEQPTRIRYRIDGVLSDHLKLPHTLRAALVSRLKIMANLDISEHRKPQDGKIDFARFAPLKLELRVASLPTANGLEDIVMRLLASARPIPLDELGLSTDLASQLKTMVRRSYGLILVCGPTGSGKTTTLHSLLAEVNTAENKIWTAEDPIEITHPGLRQIQILPRAGLTFATAMRAFLRADPDIIMVGEMRDSETTHIAIEASLTGHLVLSTLHTNSAPESVVRLLDMGLDPFSFSDALVGVLSQRLARRLCKHCKVPMPEAEASVEMLALANDYCKDSTQTADQVLADWMTRFAGPDGSPPSLYRAAGCAKCNHTGHKGRVGIYELMTASPAIKKLIQARSPVDQLFKAAVGDGMLTLKQYGLLKIMEGLTDPISVHSACA